MLTLGVSPAAPLAARLELTADRPVTVRATITVGDEHWEHAYDGMQARWSVPLLRFLPDTRHEVTIEVTDAEGRSRTAGPMEVTTPALPAQFPQLTVQAREPSLQEPGLLIFAVPPVAMGAPSHVVALDEAGRIVWYYESMARISDAVPLGDGTILLSIGRARMREIDMLGNEIRTFHARRDAGTPMGSIAVETDTFHHEVSRLQSGSYLTLSTEVRTYEGYPTSVEDPTPRTEAAHVVGDVVVQFGPDGRVERELSLFDVLDIYRFNYDSFGSFWDTTYAELAPGTIDWTHANAVVIDPADGNWVISMRHQDAVLETTQDGEVRWILGPPNGWSGALAERVLTPLGDDFEYPYMMHAPDRTASGSWLLFDNGVGRASPPDPELPVEERYSRAVEYEIDEDALTVRQVWQYGRERGFELYSSIVGDADLLPETGNVSITFGGLMPSEEGLPAAHLIEVTHETPARVVREITLDDDNPDGPASRIIYRSEHVTSLYGSGA